MAEKVTAEEEHHPALATRQFWRLLIEESGFKEVGEQRPWK
jgi:hypothetical protein